MKDFRSNRLFRRLILQATRIVDVDRQWCLIVVFNFLSRRFLQQFFTLLSRTSPLGQSVGIRRGIATDQQLERWLPGCGIEIIGDRSTELLVRSLDLIPGLYHHLGPLRFGQENYGILGELCIKPCFKHLPPEEIAEVGILLSVHTIEESGILNAQVLEDFLLEAILGQLQSYMQFQVLIGLIELKLATESSLIEHRNSLPSLVLGLIQEFEEVEVETHAEPVVNADLLMTKIIEFEVKGSPATQLDLSLDSIWTLVAKVLQIHNTHSILRVHKRADLGGGRLAALNIIDLQAGTRVA